VLGADDPEANCWLTSIVVDGPRAGWRAADLAAHLAARNVETRPVFKPMHLQPVFADARTALNGAAQHLFENGITLPSGSTLREPQVRKVFDSIMEFLEARR
jgi:dTDP-4-amino-4,6-dideoxygalactose transaminase